MRSLPCQVGALEADAATLDLLARLRLSARRLGIEVRLLDATPELRELVAFAGLTGALGLEPGREPEEREEPLGVEEEGQLDDPAT
jgi:gamma-glutamyl:cysteine ligase YbdK (ATP-grasp superfamily)